jgi:uncharacterized protein with PQ loop repeat
MGQFLGFLAAVCFALCAAPQSIKAIKDRHTKGVSGWMLTLWLAGEVFAISYAVIELGSPFWLMVNYIMSTLTILPVTYYKLKDLQEIK